MAWKPWLEGGIILILAGGICTEEAGERRWERDTQVDMHITLLEG